jgi:hypothetical protein
MKRILGRTWLRCENNIKIGLEKSVDWMRLRTTMNLRVPWKQQFLKQRGACDIHVRNARSSLSQASAFLRQHGCYISAVLVLGPGESKLVTKYSNFIFTVTASTYLYPNRRTERIMGNPYPSNGIITEIKWRPIAWGGRLARKGQGKVSHVHHFSSTTEEPDSLRNLDVGGYYNRQTECGVHSTSSR